MVLYHIILCYIMWPTEEGGPRDLARLQSRSGDVLFDMRSFENNHLMRKLFNLKCDLTLIH